MRTRFALVCGFILMACALPAPAQDGKDSYGDALPEGAKARLGTERMRNLDGYGFLTADGKSIIQSASAGMVKIDVATGLSVKFGKFEYGAVPSIVSVDGTRGVAMGLETVAVVEIETGKKLYEIKRKGYISAGSISISQDGKFFAIGGDVDDKAEDKGVSVRVFDVEAKKELPSIKVAQNSSAKAVLSGDGKTLATFGFHYDPKIPYDQVDPLTNPAMMIQFWEAGTGKAISKGIVEMAPWLVALTPDGKTCAVSASNGLVTLIDTKTGKPTKQLIGRSRLGRFLVISADGKAVASCGSDGTVQMWSIITGKSLGITPCPMGSESVTIRSMVFPSAERLVAYVTRGVAGVVWECPGGKQLSPAGGPIEALSGVAFANDDKEVVTTGSYSTAVRWDLTGKNLGNLSLVVPGSKMDIGAYDRIRITPDSKMAFRMESDSNCFYDLATGVQRCALSTINTYGAAFAFAKDGGMTAMLMGGAYSAKPKPGKVVLADIAKSEMLGGFELPLGEPMAAAFTADGKILAVMRREKKDKGDGNQFVLNGFEVPGGKQISEIKFDDGYSSVFLTGTPSPKTVLVTHSSLGFQEIDVTTGKKIRDVAKGNIAVAFAPSFAPDDKTFAVATGSNYGSLPSEIQVRDWETGKIVQKFSGHTRPVTALAFSKSGKMLASTSGDTTTLIWDLTKAKD